MSFLCSCHYFNPSSKNLSFIDVLSSTTGNDADCPFDSNYEVHGKGCNNYVLVIHDKEAYPEDPDLKLAVDVDPEHYLKIEDHFFQGGSGWKHVPDVFLSGAVHGNERVGPTTLVELSELLLEAAHCESLPRMRHRPEPRDIDDASSKMWEEELAAARLCRWDLADNKGIPPPYRQWLARLVSTRRTVVIPTANALGYSRDDREEAGIDPNRDFPFDISASDSDDCMQTIAGRSINELFRSHLFPIGLTFHGGMEVIGYEWGAPTYLHMGAPDAFAQNAIASAYSRYANGFPGHVAYDYGTMNDKVYYVRGGMEDWAFAGSWDPDRVVECTPTTFGGYSRDKTKYNNSTLRSFNMLVETSDPKTPGRAELGTRTNPLVSSDGAENGHIARNMRLALVAMDVVEPYVSFRGVEGLEFVDDVIPQMNMRRYNGVSYFENSKMIWVPSSGFDESDGSIKVSWTVGGAFDIDDTELVVGLWDSIPTNLADAEDGSYPSAATMDVLNSEFFITSRPSSTVGRTRWHVDGSNPTTSSNNTDRFSTYPTFEATIDTSIYPPRSILAVFARAKVDEDWLQQPSNVGPSGLGPTSHIVNARRNPTYLALNAGKVIRGKVDDWWYSDPIAIVMSSDDKDNEAEVQLLQDTESNDAPRSVDGNRIKAIHLNSRFDNIFLGPMGAASGGATKAVPNGAVEAVSEPASTGTPANRSNLYPLGILFILINLVALASLIRRRRRRRYVERIASDDLEFGVSVEPYHDDPVDGTEQREID